MSRIYVCNLVEMPDHAASPKVSHLVSLVSPDELPATPECIAIERHHRVGIHDISEPLDGHVLPEEEHVEGLIEFVRAWRPDEAPILIHCVAGISRSMAAALITMVIKAPGREMEAARHLRDAAPHAWPNRRMIELADQMLGCEGRVVAARETMGPANLLPFGALHAFGSIDERSRSASGHTTSISGRVHARSAVLTDHVAHALREG